MHNPLIMVVNPESGEGLKGVVMAGNIKVMKSIKQVVTHIKQSEQTKLMTKKGSNRLTSNSKYGESNFFANDNEQKYTFENRNFAFAILKL